MNTDPGSNVVTFRFGAGQELTAVVPARTLRGVERAWQEVTAGHRDPAAVAGIDLRWQPTVPDRIFLERTFADCDATYRFPRPYADAWDEALADARAALEADVPPAGTPTIGAPPPAVPAAAPTPAAEPPAAARPSTAPPAPAPAAAPPNAEPPAAAPPAAEPPAASVPDAEPPAGRASAGHASTATPVREGELVPVAHSVTLPAGRELWAQAPSVPVVPGKVFATLARVVSTPDGPRAGDPVRWAEAGDDAEFPALLRAAADRILGRLEFVDHEHDGTIRSADLVDPCGPFATAALLVGDLHRIVHARYGWDDVLVLEMLPGKLTVVPADGWTARGIGDWTLLHPLLSSTFRSTTFRLGANGLEVVAEGNRDTGPTLDSDPADPAPDATEPAPHAGPAQPDATDGAEPGAPAGTLLPVLRSTSLSMTEWVRQTRPYWPVVGDRLYATLAWVAPTPWGTIGMNHVLRAQVADGDDFVEKATAAIRAVGRGLQVYAIPNDDGDLIYRLRREEGFYASSAICLPDFHERMSGIVGSTELIAAITCPDDLFLAVPGTTGEKALREMVDGYHPEEPPEVLPTLLRITADGMEFLAENTL